MAFNKHKLRNFIGVFVCILGVVHSFLNYGQTIELKGFSSRPVTGNPMIVLLWSSDSLITEYDIFRKKITDIDYPDQPINQNQGRIKPKKNCAEIKLALNPEEWNLLDSIIKGKTEPSFKPLNECDFDLYKSNSIGRIKYKAILSLAQSHYRIAAALGLACEDKNVTDGIEYYYKIIGYESKNGKPVPRDSNEIKVKAGLYFEPASPDSLRADTGDRKIQLTWKEDKTGRIVGYQVYRSLDKNWKVGVTRINASSDFVKLTNRLSGDTIKPNLPGFVDFQRYDKATNLPIPHDVGGNKIDGPKNNTKYYYKVKAVDIFGIVGPPSDLVEAMPIDLTPPQTPLIDTVIPNETNSSIEIIWNEVSSDIYKRNEEKGVPNYFVYRYDSMDVTDLNKSGYRLPVSFIQAPTPDGWIKCIDKSASLRDDYKDKTWWYRVMAQDAAGNYSDYSTAVSGTLKDTTRPALVTGVHAEGDSNFIKLKWKPNIEPDITGYYIYRSICDTGIWHCPHPDTCRNDFVFLGQVTHDSVMKVKPDGPNNWFYKDRSVPPKSPVCYAYLIKAYDKSGNRSGKLPPDKTEAKVSIVCERLKDKTPPEPSIISGLFARDNAILLEWIQPPTQDINCFYVYRAEDENINYTFIAMVTVNFPKRASKVIYGKKLIRPDKIKPCICDSIPSTINEYMTSGTFTDTTTEQKKTYWYKVVGVDHEGNEGEISKAVEISTFTFSTKPDAILKITIDNHNSAGLKLLWDTSFDQNQHQGFAVFKSPDQNGPYFQISNIIKDNFYLDSNVLKGKQYWYKVAILDIHGNVNTISDPMMGQVNP